MTCTRIPLLLTIVLGVVGCAGASGTPDAGDTVDGSDAADASSDAHDAGLVSDASSHAQDAGLVSDASPVDAFRPDDDLDGVPTEIDCDDYDAEIGRTASRSCDNACGPGTVECTDGEWGDCSAPVDCFCEPAQTRLVACGRCGMQAERCGSDGTWEAAGSCLGQGECEPGSVDVLMYLCGRRERLCTAECRWTDGEWVVPSGDCRPGESIWCLDDSVRPCTETCRFPCAPR